MANNQQASLDTASPSVEETNPNHSCSDPSHFTTNPQDKEGNPHTLSKDFPSPKEANRYISKEGSISTALSSASGTFSKEPIIPKSRKKQYSCEQVPKHLEEWNLLDLVALKEEPASSSPKDPFHSDSKNKLFAAHERSFNNCFVNHLDLYVNEPVMIVISSSVINDMLLIIHGYVSGGHLGMYESLRRLVSSDYYWPSMKDDMKNHVRSCPSCQKTAHVSKPNTPSTESLWADIFFANLNVDTIGPLPPDQEANKYILVIMDSFTRFTIPVTLTESNARLTADALIWSAVFGIHFSNHIDNGPEFANNVFK
ncbi:hypothetical protein P9112_009530 [Eukaryota sp. TZLM1-RC]